MTRIAVFLLGCLLLAPAAPAQTIRFQEMEHDFGRLKQQASAKYEFAFTNIGKDTAYLLPPEPGCGCTAALLSESVIPPGRTGKVGVEFHSYAGSLGQIEKNVRVYQNVGGTKSLSGTLTIKAEIVGEIIPDPMLAKFQTDEGKRASVTIRLTSNSDVPLTLDNVSAAIMQYIDTTAGTGYSAQRVISKPLTDYTLTLDDKVLAPRATTVLHLDMAADFKGQMNGHVRIVLPHSEVRVPVVGVVYRPEANTQRPK